MDNKEPDGNTLSSIQSFVPINGPHRILAQPEEPARPAKETKKRKRKQRDNDLPSPQRSAKATRKTRQTTKKARIDVDDKAAENRDPVTKATATRPVLSGITRAKLNTFRYDESPTTCTKEGETLEDLEDLPTHNGYHNIDMTKTSSDQYGRSDRFLSGDVWANHKPLPDHPWLYGAYQTGESDKLESVDNINGETLESQFFAEFLQTEAHQQPQGEETMFVDDEELDRLFNDILNDKAEPSELRQTEHLIHRPTSSVPIEETTTENRTSAEDFSLNQEMLRSLCEVSSVPTSPTKPATDLEKIVVDEMEDLDFNETELQELLRSEEDPSDSRAIPVPGLQQDCSVAAIAGKMPSKFQLGAAPLSPRQKQPRPVQDPRARFARPLHPHPLQTPSPIPGLSIEKRILTCFRIGEAINAAVKAQKQGHRIFLELYARVIRSTRAGPVQTFRFVDLWSTASSPGIMIEGRWIGWEGAELWEKDGRVFFEDYFRDTESDEHGRKRRLARKCRIVGSLKREATGSWMLDIKNLWEAGWDDIAWSKQIFCEPDEDEARDDGV